MWFLMSDKDGDKLLDGHELLLALNEGMDAETGLPLKDSIEHVDTILREDDENGDGKISYEEFMGSAGI
jgi:Ca2+-binding EF-hand superfamily protein